MPQPRHDDDSMYDFDSVHSRGGRRRSPSPRGRSRSPPRRGGRRSRSRSPSPVRSYDDYSDSFVSDDDDRQRKPAPRAAPRRGAGGGGGRFGRGRGRGARHITPRSELIAMADVVTKRVLSARKVKINDLRSELQDTLRQMDELRDENKLLRKLERRQGKALDKYDREENELPSLIKQHGEEVRGLKERLRKERQRSEDSNHRLKQKDKEIQKLNSELKRLRDLNEDKQLLERGDLNRKLATAENNLEDTEKKLSELKRHVEHLNKNHRHELGIELARHKETQRQLRELREAQEKTQETLKEREKELEMKNIYANRLIQRPPAHASTATTPLPGYGETPRRLARRRSGSQPRPSPRVPPREKAKQFEEKRREEERRKREARQAKQFLRESNDSKPATDRRRSPPPARRRSPSPPRRHSASPVESGSENEWEKWEREQKERDRKRDEDRRRQEEEDRKILEAADRRKREREDQEQRERERKAKEREAEERERREKRDKEDRERRDREEREKRDREDRDRRDREERQRKEREEEERRERQRNDQSAEDRQRADEERRKKDLLLARMREIDNTGDAGGSNQKTWKSSRDETKETFERMYQGKPAYDEGQAPPGKKKNSFSLFDDDDGGQNPQHGRRAGGKKNDLINDLFGDSSKKTTKRNDDIFADDFGGGSSKKAAGRRQGDSKMPWEEDDFNLDSGYTPSAAGNSKAKTTTKTTFGDPFFDSVGNDQPNNNDKLLPRRTNKPASTFSSRPAVTAIDPNDDDVEELTL